MANDQKNTQKPQLVSVTTSPHACNVPHSSDDPLPTTDNGNEAKNKNNNNNNHGVPTTIELQGRIDQDTEEYFRSFPPGYRFCPSDTELIVHYLTKKINKENLPRNKIHEVNLYKYSPEKISEIYPVLGEKEWYFFTPRDRKYSNGTRPNRAAGTGYWKATGADKAIRNKGLVIGFRKALVFYEGRPPKGEKTSWIMHEYRVNAQPRKKSYATDMRLDDYVLCRIYKKTDKSFKSRPKNEDEQNNDLYIEQVVLSQSTEENVQSQSDSHSHYEKMDDHMEEAEDHYRDYPQPVLPNEVLEIPPLHCDVPNISSGNANLFPSFDYVLGQLPVSSLPAPSISPARNYKWDSKLKVLPITPIFSTTNNALGADYFKEGWWDFKPQGLQEQIWDKTSKDFLPLDYDLQNMSFLDSEVNLDTILNNNPPPSSSFDGTSMPKSERD